MPSNTMEKEIAEKERGRLHTNSLKNDSILWTNLLDWRLRDDSVVAQV